MNDAQRLEAMDSYFGRYRKMMGRLKASEQEYEDTRKAYEQRRTELQEERTRIARELTNMRQVITKMIDTGFDPTMAGLSMDDSDAKSIWQQQAEESFGMPISDEELISSLNSNLGLGQVSPNMQLSLGSIYSTHSSSGATGATGITGATGAIGSISWGPNGGHLEGYGAIPPRHMHPGVTADMRSTINWDGDYHDWTSTAEQ